jgi:hypothetical protein
MSDIRRFLPECAVDFERDGYERTVIGSLLTVCVFARKNRAL